MHPMQAGDSHMLWTIHEFCVSRPFNLKDVQLAVCRSIERCQREPVPYINIRNSNNRTGTKMADPLGQPSGLL
jgi:hypothetical protein